MEKTQSKLLILVETHNPVGQFPLVKVVRANGSLVASWAPKTQHDYDELMAKLRSNPNVQES